MKLKKKKKKNHLNNKKANNRIRNQRASTLQKWYNHEGQKKMAEELFPIKGEQRQLNSMCHLK
jgi:hypothetical protein